MTIRVIPVRVGAPIQEMKVDLDGVAFQLELRWNERAPAWVMTLRDDAGVVLREGIRVCYGGFLLPTRRPNTFPAGELLLVSREEGAPDPGLEDLGVNSLLVYMEAVDMLAVEAT